MTDWHKKYIQQFNDLVCNLFQASDIYLLIQQID